MKLLSPLILLLLFTLSLPSWAQEKKKNPPSKKRSNTTSGEKSSKTPEWVTYLVQQLGNPDWERREEATRFLRRYRMLHKVRRKLKQALVHPDPEVRWRAQSLYFMNKNEVHRLLREKIARSSGGYGYYDGQFANLVKYGSSIHQGLIEILKAPQQGQHGYKIRYLAALAVGELQVKGAKPVLVKMMKSGDMTSTAICSLAKLGETKYLKAKILECEAKIRSNPANIGYYQDLCQYYRNLNQQQKIIQTYKMAIRFARKREDKALFYYNMACAYSMAKELQKAMDALQKAHKLGYNDYGWMLKDGDLNNVKKLPAFRKLIESMKNAKKP